MSSPGNNKENGGGREEGERRKEEAAIWSVTLGIFTSFTLPSHGSPSQAGRPGRVLYRHMEISVHAHREPQLPSGCMRPHAVLFPGHLQTLINLQSKFLVILHMNRLESSGTRRSNKKARSPIFPVLIWTKRELSTFWSPSCSLRCSFAGGSSASSSARPDLSTSLCHRSFHSLTTVVWILFRSALATVSPSRLSRCVLAAWYSGVGDSRVSLLGMVAQLSRMSCPMTPRFSFWIVRLTKVSVSRACTGVCPVCGSHCS